MHRPSNQKNEFASAIYEGKVRHRRYSEKYNAFCYRVFMVYLDLQEIDQVFAQSRWWSVSRFNLARFKRTDYLDGQSDKTLYDAVADLVQQHTGVRPAGPIRMLTNLRYFGFIINPITCYYCFDEKGQELQTVVAEVTNTPWGERCHYVLPVVDQHRHKQRFQFAKSMHVSPYQPMDLQYDWRGKTPGDDLLVHIDVKQQQRVVLDATMVLERQALTKQSMNRVLRRYPVMTLKVFASIYWQALKLTFKAIKYHPNPGDKSLTNNVTNNAFDSSGVKR